MTTVSLHTILNYDFTQKPEKTGHVLAIVNNNIALIDTKTLSIWRQIVLWFTNSCNKQRIAHFVITHQNEWRSELSTHEKQVAFEKKCMQMTYKFFKDYSFSFGCKRRLYDNLPLLKTLQVRIQHPYKDSESGACIETHRTITFDRFTRTSEIDWRLLNIIRQVQDESRERLDVSVKGLKADKESYFITDEEKLEDRTITITCTVRPQRETAA